jgi:hypothetical protein
MRARILGVVVAVLVANVAVGKDVYLSIGGEVGNFFTDARVFNPSFDKDIVITARYLQGNQDNTGATTKTVNVPKRTMLALDNVVSVVFQTGGIGAIRLTSDDDFVATQRIYARLEGPKTLGQFVPGLDSTTALKKGALIQLKQNGGPGTIGTFRTNIGGVNPNAVAANVTFKLYDKNNAVVQTKTFKFEPFGVLTPSGIAAFFNASTADLSDAWVSFDSDQSMFMYGSIVDNGSDDPTFITASADSGTAPPTVSPTVTMVASNFKYTVTGGTGLAARDNVKFVLSSTEGTHGYRLVSPEGQILIDILALPGTPTERVVTLPQSGTYFFFCTFSECGVGHSSMSGELTVGEPRSPGGNPRY